MLSIPPSRQTSTHGLSRLLLVLLFAPISCSPTRYFPPPMPNATRLMPGPAAVSRPVGAIECVAQRGGAGLAAENTLNAFRIGINFRPDFVEMDVHLTKDRVPIVMHDPTIDRTTEGRGRIADLTLAELGRYSTHSTSQSYREPIPTLAEVLDLAKSKYVRVEVGIQLDADGGRYPGIEQKVLAELTTRGMLDQARVLSLDFDTLKQVRAIHPGTKTVALLPADSIRRTGKHEDAVVDELAPFADGISVDKAILSAALIEAAHRRHMSVGVWTVDTEKEMALFADMGVDSISTNRPDMLNRVFGR